MSRRLMQASCLSALVGVHWTVRKNVVVACFTRRAIAISNFCCHRHQLTRCVFLRRWLSTSGLDDSIIPVGSPISSKRGRRAVQLLPTYLADARRVQLYHEKDCPDGALQLSVAETKLMEDWIVPVLNDRSAVIGSDAIYYQPTPGRQGLRKAMARYMQQMLNLSQSSTIFIDGLVVGAGCNAVLENLCLVLAEPGEVVLIPTPYYAAFEFDLVARAGLTVVPVTTQSYQSTAITTIHENDPAQKYYPTIDALDAAYDRAVARTGSPPKILLLSHPSNPLGIAYPPWIVKDSIEWCRRRQVHLISDEIYAGSVYRPDKANFVSTLALAGSTDGTTPSVAASGPGLGLGPYIHWVYSFSKDFGLSGMRLGAAYTENEEIVLPLQKLNDLCQLPSSTQIWLENILSASVTSYAKVELEASDVLWHQAYADMNHQRLAKRSLKWTQALDDCGIPYLAPTAGLFVWMDLSSFLPPPITGSDAVADMQRRERELYLQLMNKYGLLFTPGLSMRNEEPCFFRCVFTAVLDQSFDIALHRLRKFAAEALRS